MPIWLACILTRLPTRSLTRSNNLINYPFLSTPFMYIYHLISIDLELSRSLNSPTLALLQLWVRIALPAKLINLLPYLRSHYFYHLCKCLELLYLPNERTVAPGRRTYPTDERTDESKNVKIRFRQDANLGPCLTCQILKMITNTDGPHLKFNLILEKPSDWMQWFFII